MQEDIIKQHPHAKKFIYFQVKLNGRLDEKLSDIGIDLKQKNLLVIKKPSTQEETTESTMNNKTFTTKTSTTSSTKMSSTSTSKLSTTSTTKMSTSSTTTTTNMIINDSSKQQEIVIETEISSDDDLALGASASPTEQISNSPTTSPTIFDKPALEAPLEPSSTSASSFNRSNDYQSKSSFFVGLVNQAMTCYMNSLLQSLYMTPEFRNALYNWEFDGTGESKSIPFQLQKLFINLQTSNKMAVETTDLTKSFGWDSTEAWQQHDIQELCRVMFDALEQKFKNTPNADLINRLYEGKMVDYVKCLECETEKQREDTFLDVPLPVRPFGSTVAYESVEEAIKAFVQPETLDGNNQYFCEKCNKKCDAHKGLKFSKFPYILTLHLKRFDFDYQTLHRIKLNDKVTFPQQLNLNNLINNSMGFESQSTVQQQVPPVSVNVNTTKPSDVASIASVESAVKCDDSSTTDSVLDDEGSIRLNVQNLDTEQTEDDEGIDMSVNDSKSVMSNSTSIDSSTNNTGPYNYELFSIMIHSGSASGGHYYAYIKDLESNNWFSFNDQTVSTITQEDISKTFGGGGAFKSYYSGFSSSTNAYMLMYRQQDPSRNCLAVKEENFPKHIKNLVERVRNRDENDRRQKELESEMVKLKIYFKNPYTRITSDTKVFMISESTLQETLEDAYSRLNMKSIAPISRCRLVAYENSSGTIEKSFEGCDKDHIGYLMSLLCNRLELLLEVRDEDKEFEIYYAGGIMTRVYQVHVNYPLPDDIDGPICVRGYEQKPLSDYKLAIAEKLKLGSQDLTMALKNNNDKVKIISDDTKTLRNEFIYGGTKVFVTSASSDENRFRNAVDEFENIFTLYFSLPNNKKDTLEKLSIPSYEVPVVVNQTNNCSVDVVDSVAFALPTNMNMNNNNNNNNNDNCNSEDSSLSDSDRTLVEDSFQMCKSPPNPPSMHHSPYGDHCDQNGNDSKTYFFKGIMLKGRNMKNGSAGSVDSGNEETYEESADSELNQKILKVLVDKRMSVNKLKELIQPFVKIPMEYFKIFRQLHLENECTRLQDSLSATFKDDERLVIELGRALRKGEFKVKLYYLNILEVTDIEKLPFVCDYILRNGAEVGPTKREILAHIGSVDEKYSKLTYERSRLRKKNWKSPSLIFIDNQKFGDDITISNHTQFELIIQEMPDDATLDFDGHEVNDDCRSIFIRRFYPSKLDLGTFNEITVGSE